MFILSFYLPFYTDYFLFLCSHIAAWKIIKGWLPPKFVDRVKFVDKKTLKEWIDADNQLADWGGNDNYTYKFEPAVRTKRTMPNGRGPPDPKPRKVSDRSKSEAVQQKREKKKQQIEEKSCTKKRKKNAV